MPHTTAPVELLREVPLLAGLPQKHLKKLRDEFKESAYRPGDVLMREGTKGGRFFIVVDGKVEVSRDGRTKVILGPGDVFGEWALLDGGVRTATVTAQTDVTVLTLAPWAFKSLLLGEPELMLKVLQQTIQRHRQLLVEAV